MSERIGGRGKGPRCVLRARRMFMYMEVIQDVLESDTSTKYGPWANEIQMNAHTVGNDTEEDLAAQLRETLSLQYYHASFFLFFRFPSDGPSWIPCSAGVASCCCCCCCCCIHLIASTRILSGTLSQYISSSRPVTTCAAIQPCVSPLRPFASCPSTWTTWLVVKYSARRFA